MSDGTFTVIGPGQKPMQMTEDMLAGLSHQTLSVMRDYTTDPEVNKVLAPYEHRAFAREFTRDNPWFAPAMPALPLGYAAMKAATAPFSNDPLRTPPSLSQIGQGMMGIGEGAVGAVTDWATSMFRRDPNQYR